MILLQVRTHRLVLGSLSPMLRAALEYDGMKEEDSVLVIPEVEPLEMAEFLRGVLKGGMELAPIPESLEGLGISYQPASRMNKVVPYEEELKNYYDYYPDESGYEMSYEPDAGATGHEDPLEHQKRKGTRREHKKPSEVWKFFRKQGNGETVECLECRKIFKFNTGSTSTMFRHLKKAHNYMSESQNTIGIEDVGQWSTIRSGEPGGRKQQQTSVLLTTTKPEPLDVPADMELPPELVAPETPSKRRREQQRSNIWKFFDQDKEEATTSCKECGKRFTMGSGTSTMGRHLKKQHEWLYEEFEQLNEQDKLDKTKREEEKARENAEKEGAEEDEEGEEEAGEEGGEGAEGEEGKENRPKKKAKGEKRQRSSVWKFFQRVKNEQACCNQCGKVFVISGGTTTGLIRHLGRAHGDAYDEIFKDMEEKKRASSSAKLTFDWSTGAFVPKKEVKAERKERKDKIDDSDPTNRTCPVEGCGKVYARRRGMLAHYEAVHSERKPYQCNDCGKTFARKEGWQRHNHDTDRPYLCPTCGKTFRNPRAREVHERSHNDDRRYPCSYCEKRFFTNCQRKVHERIHTGESL